MENLSLLVVCVFFGLSLGGAFVLFKFLDATAQIQNKKFTAGGAIAGFIIIFLLLTNAFSTLLKQTPRVWTIVGKVQKDGCGIHDGVIIKYLPPSPSTISEKNGKYRMKGVKIYPGEGLPNLHFECEGYFPDETAVSKDNSIINEEKKEIILKNKMILGKLPEENEGGE